jgi:hypothetical protein
LKIFDQMGLSKSMMHPSWALFHGIVPPVGPITFPTTFGTRENFCIEYMQFEVADFEMAYNAFLRRQMLTKVIEIPHYAYLVLKMLGLNGVISIKGDVKRSYDCDRESCETADLVLASAELQELKKALDECPQTRSCSRPRLPSCPSSRRTHSARQFHYPWMSPPRLLMWGIV